MQRSQSKFNVRRATPTVDTSAYADGDHLGSLMTFTDVFSGVSNKGSVCSVQLILESGTFNGANLLLFRASPTITSSDNAALNIADAEMTAKFVGAVSVGNTAETELISLSANAVAYANNLKVPVDSTDGNLYGIMQANGAITFTAADDLTVVLGVEVD